MTIYDEIFDKNRLSFPSEWHRLIWWWGIGLVPPEVSLTASVRDQCTPNVLEGCYQWHRYFTCLCEHMYLNSDAYSGASPRQYRDVLEKIAAMGELSGDDIVCHLEQWEEYVVKTNKSKAWRTSGAQVERCIDALSLCGLSVIREGSAIRISHTHFPKIFHAMRVFENSPSVRDTPVRLHFAACEFRQLFKSYTSTYSELMRRASDDSLLVAERIHTHLKSLKVARYTHFGLTKYKHKGIRILDYALFCEDTPTLRMTMGLGADWRRASGDIYYVLLKNSSPQVKALFERSLQRCEEISDHEHTDIELWDGKMLHVCQNTKLRLNPSPADVEAVLPLISARKASVDSL